MKEYQSELTKANRRAAEDRIRHEITIKCKECGGIMQYVPAVPPLWHCPICLRRVVLTQL